MKHKPAIVVSMEAPGWAYDVNASVDKREVHVIGTDRVAQSLQQALRELWEPTRQEMRIGEGGLGLAQRGGKGSKSAASLGSFGFSAMVSPSVSPAPSRSPSVGRERAETESNR